MPIDSEKLTHIGIECESIEGDSWGVARLVYKLLEQLAAQPELARTHRFHLYFKSHIPDYPFLNAPVFVKTVTTPGWAPVSFNLHYHVWMVARAYADGVAMLCLPNYQLPLLWFKPSLVMLTEDIHAAMRDPQLPFKYRLSYLIFSNWAAKHATRIMAISRSSKEALVRLFGIAPERVAVNELAVASAQPVAPMPGRYLLYVGQAFERRHLRETIQAFESLARDDHELRLIAIGPDKYQPPVIADLVAATNLRLGRPAVQHISWVSEGDLARLYAGASALVYVSFTEAFGLPPLEALSYGVPAVVADSPVNREIYSEHAFYAAHPNDIQRAMTMALADIAHRERIRQAAPSIMARYTWQAHGDRFLNIIHDITHA